MKAKDCPRSWLELRQRHLKSLREHIDKGLVDEDIIDLLLAVNSCSMLVTTSSCSGRIVLVAAPSPGDKTRGGVQAVWHRRVEPGELRDALRLAGRSRFMWVSVQPPMLNLYACTIDCALEAARVFVSAGFKYTGVRPTGSGFPLVHVASTERIDVPLVYRGSPLLEISEELVDMLNDYLSLAKSKLQRLKRAAATVSAVCGCEDATLA